MPSMWKKSVHITLTLWLVVKRAISTAVVMTTGRVPTLTMVNLMTLSWEKNRHGPLTVLWFLTSAVWTILYSTDTCLRLRSVPTVPLVSLMTTDGVTSLQWHWHGKSMKRHLWKSLPGGTSLSFVWVGVWPVSRISKLTSVMKLIILQATLLPSIPLVILTMVQCVHRLITPTWSGRLLLLIMLVSTSAFWTTVSLLILMVTIVKRRICWTPSLFLLVCSSVLSWPRISVRWRIMVWNSPSMQNPLLQKISLGM